MGRLLTRTRVRRHRTRDSHLRDGNRQLPHIGTGTSEFVGLVGLMIIGVLAPLLTWCPARKLSVYRVISDVWLTRR